MDTVSQMLTKIRNAQMAGQKEVAIRPSKLKFALAEILKKEGFVENVAKEKEGMIKIVLKYHQFSPTKKIPAIKGIKKISKSGQRIYIKNKDIRDVRNKYGTAILSTSKGVMTGEESRKIGLGGEYICEVW
ncbi:MAG: 30S ribosomal protein S8 [Candidatus Moranbacteria bacterium RIFOXYA12_FULL_35_19]|nr:MAG: 30S ribosomal protein S8 [Candidatus Moranbacteria bacterium GW2011_GWF2_35_39]OGI31649.1 MAG: 30S ribosomal protein S8 [Candidatus Moranbacteria bacterium RIFOXYB12_FULL_35_8]OGI32819.1 MAG: 30S ribosomal protein S8 [Candidatus Moranbacteria bacterium RIFOXYC12_FULL_36_13]OGI36147.1 MAG: 30S ribosomal protein S8 [Candidatus Moranbacteria bacterium RIFOXYA12_FULL_35_19]